MNLLSVGAAYGVMTVVAQGGAVGGLIGIDHEVPIAPFMPVMMFAILFGLSMDYEVFLISRIREEYLKDRDTRRAVADGLAKTARVITAAAAIMVVVFLAFLAAPDVFLKLFGIGLASAIFLDATLVRMVLVPAVMQLLGDRNWWIPSWLEQILPRAGGRARRRQAVARSAHATGGSAGGRSRTGRRRRREPRRGSGTCHARRSRSGSAWRSGRRGGCGRSEVAPAAASRACSVITLPRRVAGAASSRPRSRIVRPPRTRRGRTAADAGATSSRTSSAATGRASPGTRRRRGCRDGRGERHLRPPVGAGVRRAQPPFGSGAGLAREDCSAAAGDRPPGLAGEADPHRRAAAEADRPPRRPFASAAESRATGLAGLPLGTAPGSGAAPRAASTARADAGQTRIEDARFTSAPRPRTGRRRRPARTAARTPRR